MSHEQPSGGTSGSGNTSTGEAPGGITSNGENNSTDPLASTEHLAQIETGLILPVPELEDFVCGMREKIAAVPPAGVPAHISLLYPYLEPQVCSWARDDVAEFFTKIEPFDFELTKVGWFDRRVVFLHPEPVDPFLDITEQLMARWTQCLPYGGKHKEVVPHLTLGIEGDDHEMEFLASAAEELLPVRCRATEAWLMEGTPRPPSWRVADRYPLGR